MLPDSWRRRSAVAAVLLVVTMLSAGDLVEVIPHFADFVASPLFPFFHETHDLLALIVALYAAHKLKPAVGVWAVTWFLALHVPYTYLTFPHEMPEIVRLALFGFAAFVGIRIIAVRHHLEERLRELATDLETQRAAQRHRADELDALRTTVTDVLAEMELSQLLPAILRRAIALLDATGGDLGLYEVVNREILIVASHNMGRDFTGTRMQSGEGTMGKVAESGEPLIVQDYATWEGRSPQYADGPWHAVMATPLLAGGQLVGVIGIVDVRPGRRFTAADLRLLNLFAQQAVLALERARLLEAEHVQAQRQAALVRLSAELAAALDEADICRRVVTGLQTTLGYAHVGLFLLDESTGDRVLPEGASTGWPDAPTNWRIPAGQGLSEPALLTGQLHYTPDVTRDPRYIAGVGAGAEVDVPVWIGDKVGGVLVVESAQPNAFVQGDFEVLTAAANQAGLAIKQARLFAEVQRLAVTDGLTGLHNRRHFSELAEDEFDRARRYGRPLSAVMLDMDHFKQVNDTHGHAVGDQVLRTVAQRCRENLRDIDLLGRYGGEEFVVLLPESKLGGARHAAERLRRCVAGSPVETEHGPLAITISLGIALLTDDCPKLAALLDRADAAMYAAKQAGRNRVGVGGNNRRFTRRSEGSDE